MKRTGRRPTLGAVVRPARGAAVVEMAVVAPLLLMIVFGIIEFGWVFMVRQTMVTAAREGARVAALQGTSEGDISTRVSDYMQPAGLTSYTLSVTRATQQDPTETVQITIPYSQITLLGEFFGPTNFNITATSSMRKEGA